MATATFDRFLKQLHATGSEKGDGFDPSHFDGLSPDERPEVARLLREALLRGDDTAAGGLILLDPEEAGPALEDALHKMQAHPWVSLAAARELWNLTGESRYQDVMIATLENPNELLRQSALVALENTPHDDRLMAALESLVRDDPDDTIRFLAAKHLLYGLGLITDLHETNHPYRQMVRDLSDESKEVREKALAELKSQYGLTQ
jgi:hypothetical protein